MNKKFERNRQVEMILKGICDKEVSSKYDGDGYVSHITYIEGYFVHVWQERDDKPIYISTDDFGEHEVSTAGEVIDKINNLITGVN